MLGAQQEETGPEGCAWRQAGLGQEEDTDGGARERPQAARGGEVAGGPAGGHRDPRGKDPEAREPSRQPGGSQEEEAKEAGEEGQQSERQQPGDSLEEEGAGSVTLAPGLPSVQRLFIFQPE